MTSDLPFLIVDAGALLYLSGVHRLTRHEQLVLCLAVGLLVIGWTVKVYRAAHPPQPAAERAKP